MYAAAILWAAAIVTAVFCAAPGAVAFCRKAWLPAAVFSAVLLAAVASLLLLRLYFRRHAAYGIATLDCRNESPERLAALFAAKRYAEDLYEGTTQRNGIRCTVAIVQTECLQESGFRKIRTRIKTALPDRETRVGLFSGGRYAQIVFVVCDRATPEAIGKAAAITKSNLHRTECLFYAVLSRADASLYFPDVYDGLEYLQVKRYAVFCEMVRAAAEETAGEEPCG